MSVLRLPVSSSNKVLAAIWDSFGVPSVRADDLPAIGSQGAKLDVPRWLGSLLSNRSAWSELDDCDWLTATKSRRTAVDSRVMDDLLAAEADVMTASVKDLLADADKFA
jgi:hypothetical protein